MECVRSQALLARSGETSTRSSNQRKKLVIEIVIDGMGSLGIISLGITHPINMTLRNGIKARGSQMEDSTIGQT